MAAVDPKGGFHQQLSRNWQVTPDHSRFVVYQARLTWTFARAALLQPEPYRDAAQHGLDFLWNRFWDHQSGGFHWWMNNEGTPRGRSQGQKHTYGIAFGLYAVAAAAQALGTEEAKGRLEEAWTWFVHHMVDEEHGGLFEAIDHQNQPLLASPDGYGYDLLGVPYGQKAQNSQLHVLEAFAEVARAMPTDEVRDKLHHMVDIIARKMKSEEGHLHLYCTRDWSPASREPSYGHDIEAAFLLRDALETLGKRDEEVEEISRHLARHALDKAWDQENGGLVEGEPIKVWWVQAESLGALVWLGVEDHPEAGFFHPYALRQLEFMEDHMLDEEHGGLYPYVSLDGAEKRTRHKGDAWTGLYHEARCFLTVMDRAARQKATISS
jgi:mannobiose 2-epimerase